MCTNQLLEVYKVNYSVVGTLLSSLMSLNIQVQFLPSYLGLSHNNTLLVTLFDNSLYSPNFMVFIPISETSISTSCCGNH